MEMSPQQVRTASFRTARKGFDPNEVSTFLREVADALEAAQNQSTAMEARARAAVARLQELTAAQEAAPPVAAEPVHVEPDQAETISRTLLLAQRTADTTIAEARAEADRLLAAARDDATATIDSTREMAALMLEEARAEARKLSEEERRAADNEVQALLARRSFLESDVDHLEQFLVEQRSRLREASTAMLELAERVPGGLGQVRRPLLSAADDDTMPLELAPSDAGAEALPSRPTGDAGASGGTDDAGHEHAHLDDPTAEEPPVAVAAPPASGLDDGSIAALAAALEEAGGSGADETFHDDPTPADDAQQLRLRPEHPDGSAGVGR